MSGVRSRISDVVESIGRLANEDPLAPALRAPDGSTTSRASLHDAASRVSHELHRLGLGPGDVVAIHARRGAGAVTAMVGALGAGVAWLPLDADLPPARLMQLLGASGCRAIIDCERSMPRNLAAAEIVDLAPIVPGAQLVVLPVPSQEKPIVPEDTAYVMFTSGTTGEPKGVVVSRRALAHFAQAAAERYPVQASDRVLQFASLSFDISVEEIFLALATGATLVLRPPGPMSPRAFLETCAREDVSVASLPTAFWHQLTSWIETTKAVMPAGLHTVIIGGEAVAAAAVESWRSEAVGVRLINTYGPTETTVAATACELTAEGVGLNGEPPSIGTPLAGVRVELRTETGAIVHEAETAAQLHIGGPAVGSGYLIEGSFDPLAGGFHERDGERWYDSGDIARRDHNGEMHFVGRLDDQVKVRGGFRVTLGEVEHAVSSLPRVRSAAVVAPVDRDGIRELVAGVVLESGSSTVTEAEVLRAQLPAYAVPRMIVLDELPLTPQGKVDRKALVAKVDQGEIQARIEDPLAAALAEWSRVLGRADVDGETHLFGAGGDSIGATRIAVGMSRHGYQVDVIDVFEEPTPRGLVARIARHGRPSTKPVERALLQRAPRRDGVFPSTVGQEVMYRALDGAPDSHYRITDAFDIEGRLDVDALRCALDGLVSRHEALRTGLHDRGASVVQQLLPSMSCPLRTVRAAEGELKAVLDTEMAAPFDLQNDLKFRACLAERTDQRLTLLLSTHHIVADGWSLGVLQRDLSELYRAEVTGEEPDLPPLGPQLADFANWQRLQLRSGELQVQLAWWETYLAGTNPVEFSGASVAEAGAVAPAVSVPVTWDEEHVAAVHSCAAQAGVSTNVALLAGFIRVLNRHFGIGDAVVASAGANRPLHQLYDICGFLSNTIYVRLLDDGGSFDRLLERTQRQVMGAASHDAVPWETVDPGERRKLFTTRFIVHPPFASAWNLQLTGAQVTPRPLPSRPSSKRYLDVALFDAKEVLGSAVYRPDVLAHEEVVALLDETLHTVVGHGRGLGK